MKDVHVFLLAGGESKRFKKESKDFDKALLKDANWGGVPLLINAINLFTNLNIDLTIIVNDKDRKEKYLEIINNHGLKNMEIITDYLEFSIRGPLNSMLTGIRHSKKPFCLFYPIDMPYIKQELIELLYSNRKKGGIISFIYPDGKIEPLFSLINRERIREIAHEINVFRKDRPSALFRGMEKLFFISITKLFELDPTLKSFININTPESVKLTTINIPDRDQKLDSLQLTKKEINNNELKEILTDFPQIKPILHGNYWIASYLKYIALTNLRKRNDCLKLAIKYYKNEKDFYDKHNLNFLSRHVALNIGECKELFTQI